MEVMVLGSSSRGNGYVFKAADGVLLLEQGCKAADLKKSLRYKMDNVVGAVVSHCHNDHSGFIKDYLQMGITTLALEHVFEQHNIRNRAFCKTIEPMKGYRVGGFKVFTLPVDHDVPCLGFIISHPEMGNTLFVTDTMMLQYRLPRSLNHIMIEANYCDEMLQKNIDSGFAPEAMKPRLMRSHMELHTTCEILRANDLTECQDVILVHLSEGNSDEQMFIHEVERACGKPTYVAKAGARFELNKI